MFPSRSSVSLSAMQYQALSMRHQELQYRECLLRQLEEKPVQKNFLFLGLLIKGNLGLNDIKRDSAQP